MVAKKRLEDLYHRGQVLELDDEEGGVVQIWLQKLNPVEAQACLKAANAARARSLSVRSDLNSDEYQSLWLEVEELTTKEDLVEHLMQVPIYRATERAEAKLASQEPWSKDDYIQGLKDAWVNELSEKHLTEPDEETNRVKAELTKFAEEAEAMAEGDINAERAKLNTESFEDLQTQVFKKIIDDYANRAWFDAMRRTELYYGVRDPENHHQRYFSSKDEINNLSHKVLLALYTGYSELSVDVVEGKDSGETPTSLISLEA